MASFKGATQRRLGTSTNNVNIKAKDSVQEKDNNVRFSGATQRRLKLEPVEAPELSALQVKNLMQPKKDLSSLPKISDTILNAPYEKTWYGKLADTFSGIFKPNEKPSFAEASPIDTIRNLPNAFKGLINDDIADAKHVGGKIASGTVSVPRNIAKASGLINNKLYDIETKIENKLTNDKGTFFKDTTNARKVENADMVKGLNKTIGNIDKATQNPNADKITKLIGDALGSLPQMALNFVPGVGPALFGISAGGGYAEEAAQQGATENQQLAYGAIGGIGEVALQRALGIIPGIKNIWSGKAMSEGNLGKEILKNAVREAAEESSIDPIMGFAQKFIYNPNKKVFGKDGVIDLGQMGYDGLVGAAMSLLLSAAGLPSNFKASRIANAHLDKQQELTTQEANSLAQQYAEDVGVYEQNKEIETAPAAENVDTPVIPEAIEAQPPIENEATAAQDTLIPESNIISQPEVKAVQNDILKPEDVAFQKERKAVEIFNNPWKVTRKEYVKSRDFGTLGQKGIDAKVKAINEHRQSVADALKKGENVSDEVLKDYPELKPQEGISQPEVKPVQNDTQPKKTTHVSISTDAKGGYLDNTSMDPTSPSPVVEQNPELYAKMMRLNKLNTPEANAEAAHIIEQLHSGVRLTDEENAVLESITQLPRPERQAAKEALTQRVMDRLNIDKNKYRSVYDESEITNSVEAKPVHDGAQPIEVNPELAPSASGVTKTLEPIPSDYFDNSGSMMSQYEIHQLLGEDPYGVGPNATSKKNNRTMVEPKAAITPTSDKEFASIGRFASALLEDAKKVIKTNKNREMTPAEIKSETKRNRNMGHGFLQDIKNRDFAKLTDRLHAGNKHSLRMFTEVTGLSTKNSKETTESIRSLDEVAYDKWLEEKAVAKKDKADADEKARKEEKETLSKEAYDNIGNTKISISNNLDTFKNHIQKLFDEGFRVSSTNNFGGIEWINTKTNKSMPIEKLTKEERSYLKKEDRRLVDKLIAEDKAKEQEEFDNLSQKDQDAIDGLFKKKDVPLSDNKTEQDTTAKFSQTMYRGEGKTIDEIYTYAKYPILGEGSYFAFDKSTAKGYGDKIIEKEVSLKNPLIIVDDVVWKAITAEADWKYGNPYGGEADSIIENIKKLKATIISKGYDGVIIQFEKDWEGDINTKTGNSVKTLRNVLGHDQVVSYSVAKEKTIDTNTGNGGKIEVSENKTPAAKIANKVVELLKNDEPFTFAELTKIADEAFDGTQGQGTYTSKDAYDAMELGVNLYILEHLGNTMKANADVAKINIKAYRQLLGLIPTQTKGNTEQQQYQQFSTPPNIAYVAAWLANINKTDTMFEPSAGIGGIALFAKAAGAKVIVNELSKRRLEILKNMPFDEFYNENAEHVNSILGSKVSPTVIVMNPPFSATAGRMGDKNSTSNAKLHMEQALKILQDGGRLVAIVGQGMNDKSPTFADWWREIKGKYNVRANIGIYAESESGTFQHTTEYKKYGTEFGVQLLIIDKTGPTIETITKSEPSLENIIDLLEGIRNDRTTIKGNANAKQETEIGLGNEGIDKDKGNSKRGESVPDSTDIMGDGKRPSKRDGGERSPGQNGSTDTGQGEKIDGAADGNDQSSGNDATDTRSEENGELLNTEDTGAFDGNESDITDTQKQQEDDVVYTAYESEKVKIKDAKPHTSNLVQSAAMASVSMPDVSYTPKIPHQLIKSGALSIAQIESIVYAGAQHLKKTINGLRKGFFIGDGTGVGKGREISGIILDNWNQGRKKAVWVTKNKPLLSDAIRDWTALGGNKDDIFQADANQKIERGTGILFTTYYTIPQGQKPNKKTGESSKLNRIDQLVNWLGKDFDGAIVFDEAHMMQNLISIKPSEMAIAGDELQNRIPNARIVYASATGATEVENLAYAQRLGLWGQGTSFADVNEFIGKIKAGGLAAMELVARDLKAMGAYIARNISFIGVNYRTLEHSLTGQQAEIYDTMAEGWQVILSNIEKYMKSTGQEANSKQKKWIMQQFWSSQQRFFNQVLTSMQMPSAIEDMKKKLEIGESCVLQLVNTNAAAEEREVSRIEEEGGSLDDMDITPKGSLLEMVNNCFPTQLFEETVDENGNKKSVPVVDSEGNPVNDPEAVKAKEELMNQIDQMQIPSSPMDLIFQEFGVDNVTEVTGRKRRFVFKRNKFGNLERQEESRSDKVVEADVQSFLDNKKQILVFSDAGGTGKSYHAGKDFKNQRKRNHYLIQAGWNASKAVQGFGRTHRTNQSSTPEYILVTTNLKGQKRFISSIARRLDQLGALTKGQRQAGGGGLFSAKDNLESTEARQALELFYRQLVNRQIPGMQAEPLLKRMGILNKIIIKGGLTSDVEELRDVTRFLNRILVLKSTEQNNVFDEFMKRVDYIVEEAIKNDRLDVGLENYKSSGAVVTDDQVVYRDKDSGAETKYVAITAKQKAIFWEYKQIKDNDNFIGFYKNKETGDVRAAMKAVDKTNSNGSVSKMYYMQSPTAGKRSHIVEASFKDKWEEVNRGLEKLEWNKVLKGEPEFAEEKLHMISGALLPVWNRLPTEYARVIKIQIDDGKTYLGRLVATHQIDEVLRNLGVSRNKEEFDTRAELKNVLEKGHKIRLVDKTELKRAKVAGEYRLEIKGNNIYALVRQYKNLFSEKIGSDWRYFIRTTEDGFKDVDSIVSGAPILEVIQDKNSGEETQAFSSSSPTDIPKSDNSSTNAKSVDDLVAIIEKVTGVPIRTGKFKQRAEGIFKVKPEVIRTKIRNNMPVISHELGHYFDKLYEFSDTKQFDNELLPIGRKTSKSSYSNKQIRAEGVAEFLRLYLTNPNIANIKVPVFLAHFEKSIDRDTLAFLSSLRNDISAIANLPSNKAIYNDVSDHESRKSTSESIGVFQKIYDSWINDKGPFERMQAFAERKGWKGKNIDLLTSNYSGFEAKAMSMMFDKQRDLDEKVIGDSLTEILEPISKKTVKKRKGDPIQERKNFISYIISRRAMDYKDRGLVMPQPFYKYEENIVAMENKYPHFFDTFDGMRKWEDNNLQLLVESGIKTQEEIEAIKFANANHIPLYRIQEATEAIRAGSGNTLGQSKKVIKRAVGSGATIISPLESMIVDAFIIRRAAETNRINSVLADMSEKIEGAGSMVEAVPGKSQQTKFTVDEIKGQLNKLADEMIKIDPKNTLLRDVMTNMKDEDLEKVLSIYRPLLKEGDNEITIYKNGKAKLYQVDREMYRAVKGLNKEQSNFLIRILNVPKKILQFGAVTTVKFVMNNMTRDTFASSIQSDAGINPVHIMRGYFSAAVKDKWFKAWLSSSGGSEYLNVNDRTQAQKIEDDVLGFGITEKFSRLFETIGEVKRNNNVRTRAKLDNSIKSIFMHTFDKIRDMIQFSEAGPRVAEFRKAIEKGTDVETAAAWSRKLSQDFLKHGYYGKELNKITAFFNANIQGNVRIVESFKNHPFRTSLRGLMYITLPTLLLYFFNHDDEDYQDLPTYRKAIFWNIPIGNGRFVSIPKPFGYGWIFGALPEIILDKMLLDDPKTWTEIKESFASSFSVPLIPSAVKPAIDVYANKSWTGTPIEGQGDSFKPSYLRQSDKTSIIASKIGDTVQNIKGLSPKQIDYLVKGYTGTVGDFFWRLPDSIKKGVETPTDVTQYPIIKSFINDSAYTSASVNDLYDYGEELGTRLTEFKETGKYKAMNHLPEEKQKELFDVLEAARKDYNKLADSFSEARKVIKEINKSAKFTATTKRLKEREIHIEMNKMARTYNKAYETFKKNNDIR